MGAGETLSDGGGDGIDRPPRSAIFSVVGQARRTADTARALCTTLDGALPRRSRATTRRVCTARAHCAGDSCLDERRVSSQLRWRRRLFGWRVDARMSASRTRCVDPTEERSSRGRARARASVTVGHGRTAQAPTARNDRAAPAPLCTPPSMRRILLTLLRRCRRRRYCRSRLMPSPRDARRVITAQKLYVRDEVVCGVRGRFFFIILSITSTSSGTRRLIERLPATPVHNVLHHFDAVRNRETSTVNRGTDFDDHGVSRPTPLSCR